MNNLRFWSVFACLILLINTSIYAKIDPNTISAAWLFEGNAEDITGNGFDGKIEGGAKFVKGRIGKAIELDGKDDFVKIQKKLDLLKKSLLHIGSTQQTEMVNGESSLTMMVGKMETFIINFTPISKSNFRLTGIPGGMIRLPIS